MLKKILDLNGTQQLSKNGQKTIIGGNRMSGCMTNNDCPKGYCCAGGSLGCVPNNSGINCR